MQIPYSKVNGQASYVECKVLWGYVECNLSSVLLPMFGCPSVDRLINIIARGV